jgi:hypothetical protein
MLLQVLEVHGTIVLLKALRRVREYSLTIDDLHEDAEFTTRTTTYTTNATAKMDRQQHKLLRAGATTDKTIRKRTN